MKIEDIIKSWDEDSKIDPTEIGSEALNISRLHSKYMNILSEERLRMRKLEADMKTLKRDKYEMYTMGPTKEQVDMGWELPARGRIIKQDVPIYMESDRDIIALSLKIGMQQEKVEMLDSIIRSIMSRGYQLKTALDHLKFTMGA
jgi:hypothetical protein